MILRRTKVACLLLALTIALVLWKRLLATQESERISNPFSKNYVGGHRPGWAWTAPPSAADRPIPVNIQRPRPNSGPMLGQLHPVANLFTLPEVPTTRLPRIQFNFQPETKSALETRLARQAAVKEAFVHSWNGYRQHAWLKDELAPVSGGHRTTLNGWAATLVDSLDTLWIMGLENEFDQAVASIVNLNFDLPESLPINVFETTIRYLGGLLGAHDVSEGRYPVLLHKAVEVGEMLYAAFDTPNRMPVTHWSKLGVEVASGDTFIAELGSLSLEFTRLSQLTGNNKFFDAIQRITNCLDSQQLQTKLPGLFPHSVNARECDFTQDVTFSLGGYADSVYEYLPKTYQLLGGASKQYKDLYERAREPIKSQLLMKAMTPADNQILFAGTVRALHPGRFETAPQMQHLSCFAGGMFALGAQLFSNPEDLSIAKKLVEGCIWAYNATASGIMPDIFDFIPCADSPSNKECSWDATIWADAIRRKSSHDEIPSDADLPTQQRTQLKALRLRLPAGISAIANRSYRLRPEAIESIFILYRTTGDPTLLEAGWTMFNAIVNATRTKLAFSAIDDVTVPVRLGEVQPDESENEGKRLNLNLKLDQMESFWTAETLKYFYLLFADVEELSLDEFVFSTEAHPFRVAKREGGDGMKHQ